ncbi:bifunctional adenosylcobinamide kinase/adenosylcobinamide-phosphate guanylyltransferase [Lysinibacillus xylanilyticus]|uniref:bifunctional adenosylcobinamide kinase/adenosylcobinamide-phosphate guanylyltransferase n=1 Tax=Lysinibacillus xylanilyticus TaxID=582475 RepID=UPI002B242263|nr:bifunctional adenosylcobinamide kinase/adenosylcobinamide-phosphate guanylyltransferase [Lysinibacillus xylanilyticus]MEB2301196.1 bifunctional adenosylcobinamide kinase/adenosylcobinamide-phosphate guanylyltransferase [Lysinibacillus xylanilyticus]
MPLIFITGGVRSGKSHFAEKAAVTHYQTKFKQAQRLIYIASGVALDREMEKRIIRHQADRQAQNIEWLTIEAPYDIADTLHKLTDGDVVLWDCVTTWLTNAFYEGFDAGTPCVEQPGCLDKKLEVLKKAVGTLLEKRVTFFIVSNELFDEPPYTNEEVELYRQMLGELHQWFVSIADEAYEIDYGVVKIWK